jgi:hypothetical protein
MTLKEIKQQFFALRNGALADAMRKQCGDTHRMIFGLNLPQLKAIAEQTGERSEALARELWADAACRESRLLAPMICPVDAAPAEWLTEIDTVEEADVVCHRLLRHHPQAVELAEAQLTVEAPLLRYAALRLLLNVVTSANAARIAEQAKSVADCSLTDGVCRQLLDECNELTAPL